jgi:hypothetical protein
LSAGRLRPIWPSGENTTEMRTSRRRSHGSSSLTDQCGLVQTPADRSVPSCRAIDCVARRSDAPRPSNAFERWDRGLLGASVGSRLSPIGTSGIPGWRRRRVRWDKSSARRPTVRHCVVCPRGPGQALIHSPPWRSVSAEAPVCGTSVRRRECRGVPCFMRATPRVERCSRGVVRPWCSRRAPSRPTPGRPTAFRSRRTQEYRAPGFRPR